MAEWEQGNDTGVNWFVALALVIALYIFLYLGEPDVCDALRYWIVEWSGVPK